MKKRPKRSKVSRQQWILAFGAVVALLAGSLIYVCFRPTSLLMFSWFKSAGADQEVQFVREAMFVPAGTAPGWIIFSVPYALWVFSCMLAQQVIWYRSAGIQRFAWIMIAPIIAIVSEVGQWLGVIPGSFDKIDALLVAIFTFAGMLAGHPGTVKHVATKVKTFTVNLRACPVLRSRSRKR